MIKFDEIPHNSDLWELFARDFLQELGFHIESPPDRGADLGKDILVTEDIRGNIYKGRFRWLVSCKHFARSGKSVNETDDERNILERMESFRAKGFLGFYSTLASSGLNSRLLQLRGEGKITDYRIFDHRLIENYLTAIGFSKLMFRYFPESYKVIKPFHRTTDKYEPLNCEVCGKDLLEEMFKKDYSANMVQVYKHDPKTNQRFIEDVYVACKGQCDKSLEDRAFSLRGLQTGWYDLSDLTIPVEFLRWLIAMMTGIRDDCARYTDDAYEKQKQIIIALSQKTLRFTTESERRRCLKISLYRF